jgi:hypothetical protein
MALGQNDTNSTPEAFADYVVTRQLAVDENTVIYRARKKGAPATEKYEKYVVVLFHALPANESTVAEGDPTLQTLLQDLQLNFLEAVKQQKKAHESGVASIVPVYDFGLAPEGAWYATDYYPRGFLKKWVTQRAGVTEEELRHIVCSTVQCLVQLKRQCKRSHGNLTPANILIGGRIGTALRDAPIILTYLPPGDEKDADRYELADLRALGQLIYQLVTQQDLPVFNQDLYPVASSEFWTLLGKHGEYWRGLCNRLLDPQLSLEKLTLAKLATELKPGLEIPLAAIGVGVALLLLLGGGTAIYWLRPRPPPPVINQPPAALEQTVETMATMAKVITLGGNDPEGKPITFQLVDYPTHGSLSGAGDTWLYQPTNNFAGTDGFAFKVNDGQQDSPKAKVVISVKALPLPANTPPTIGPIADQVTEQDKPLAPVHFTVGDQETPAANLIVTKHSSDQSLVPDANILLGGTGADRTVAITPAAGQIGRALISLIVSDGSLSATNTFGLTAKRLYAPPKITGLVDQTVKLGTPMAEFPFKVGDNDEAAENVFLARISLNQAFLPESCLKFRGSGANRVLVVDPVPKQKGTAMVGVSATDGKTVVSVSFRLEVVP